MALIDVKNEVLNCKKCSLWRTKKNPVFGEGPENADVMLIGEAPGRNEDETGRPFVGKAGRLLNDLLNEAGLSRNSVYITNIVKCRPPGNRDPMPFEIEMCSPYLDLQISIIKPRIIITLGRFSMSFIQRKFGLKEMPISKVHGMHFKIDTLFYHGYFVPMYHPAAGLYRGNIKEIMFKDWRTLKALLGDV